MTTRRDFLLQTGAAVAAGIAADALTPSAWGDDLPTTGAAAQKELLENLPIPEWVWGVTRMTFVAPGDVPRAAKAGAQVLHTNVVWPYFRCGVEVRSRRDGDTTVVEVPPLEIHAMLVGE